MPVSFWLLLAAVGLVGCSDSSRFQQWQQETIAKVQQVPTQNWDDFSAQRIPKLLQTIEADGENAPLAWLQLALVLYTHDATEPAAEIFSRLEQNTSSRSGHWPLLRFLIADDHAKKGRLDTALRTLRDSLDQLNELDRVVFLLAGARWMMENSRFAQAEAWLQQAEKIIPHHPETLYLQATVALQQGQCQRAIDKLRLMLEYKPGLKQLHAPLANAYRLCGHTELAEQSLQKKEPGVLYFENRFTRQIEQLGNPVHALRKQIKSLTRENQLTKALQASRQLLKLAPRDPVNHLNHGSILFRLGQFQKAAEAYRRGLMLAPDNADLHANLGNAYWQLGNSLRAQKHYERALDADSGYTQARLNLAGLLQQKGQWDEAEQQLRLLLQKQPDHTLGRAAWLNLLFSRGKITVALDAVAAWLRDNPKDPTTNLLALKSLLQDNVDIEQARADWADHAFGPDAPALPGASDVVALRALWLLKTGHLQTAGEVVDFWRRAALEFDVGKDTRFLQVLQDSADQLLAGKTPSLARFAPDAKDGEYQQEESMVSSDTGSHS